MSRGGYTRVDQGDDREDKTLFGTAPVHLQHQLSTSQNKYASYGSSHLVKPFQGLGSDVEIEMSSFMASEVDVLESNNASVDKSSKFRWSAGILIGLSALLGSLTLVSHYAALESAPRPEDIKQQKHPPVSIIFDEERYRYRVIDNYPLLKPNKAFNKMIGVDESEPVLAYGTFARNANDNGWDYLSAQAVDLSGYSLAESIPKDKKGHTPKLSEDEFDDLIMQQYFRALEAIGYLEGYATCVQMNEWYVNFYSGMFDGGNPTDESMEFLLSNHDWMVQQSMLYWQTSEYWRAVRGVLSQLTGIVSGANAGCPGDESTLASAEKKVYLNDLSREHSIIHILLMNANGDMYQLDDKYSQDLAAPSDVLNDIPNDDGYFFELLNNATSSTKNDDKNGDKKHHKGDEGDADLFPHPTTTAAAAAAEKKGYYYHRGEAKQRIEARRLSREATASGVSGGNKLEIKKSEKKVGSHLRSRRSQRRLSELYANEDAATLAAAAADCNTESVIEGLNTDSTHRRLNMQTHRVDHCSALIKLLDDKSDILFGHDTWDDYQNAAPRIFKHYTINLMDGAKPNGTHEVQFSSSPGMVTSNDDFFISKGNANIAVIETTIDMSNRTLLNDITYESMLSWGRSHIANQLATDGENWCELFSMYHSGTYVNQWMVLNFDKFTPRVGPQEGFLHVLEEVPTFIHYEDVTDVLVTNGYWGSYNVPYFTDIMQLSLDYEECLANPEFCYNTDPRAEIFKRDQGKIAGLKDMQWMMGYNDFQHDPLSLNDSCQSIACRLDLEPNITKAMPFGAIDSKISSVMLAMRPIPITLTRLGPTHDEQEPFCWAPWDERRNARGEKYHHAGHPPCFDFDWQTMPPFAEV